MDHITGMTFETFSGILQDEGMTDSAIKVIWDERPDVELHEEGLRDCAREVKKYYPQYFQEGPMQ